ncbi:MAG: tRNA adenosine(34) deaminase TadA [Actinomycetota bacterium]|nr:tRNA adenosine(34) deaminase TadA [Actinomycetota bacterium]
MSDEAFMRLALDEARAALVHDDVPVGAVVVRDGLVVSSAHNRRELLHDATAHAEIIAIRRACERAGSWHLEGCTIFVTMEPCAMCAGAMVASRLDRVVYAAPDLRAGAAYSLYNIVQDPRLNHRCEVTSEVLAELSVELLQTFFASKRGEQQSL